MTPTTLITSAKNCNVEQFMRCLFDNDFAALGTGTPEELAEAWMNIFNEFLDLSGSSKTEELRLRKLVGMYTARNKAVATWFWLQHESLEHLKEPHEPSMEDLRKINYKLKWNGDVEDFKAQLTRYQTQETSYQVKLKEAESALNTHLSNQAKVNQATMTNSRAEFVRTLIELRKFSYPFKNNELNVEELAIMLNDYRVAAEKVRKQ